MGVASGLIYLREGSTGNTAQGLASSFNTMTKLVMDAGMLAVSDADYPGQAGNFVAGSPLPGETDVGFGRTAGGHIVVGERLFKHPTSSIYLRIKYIDYGHNGSASRQSTFFFSVARALVSGALVNLSPDVAAQGAYPSTSGSVSQSHLPFQQRDIIASCGEGYIWILAKSHYVFSNSNSYASYPSGATQIGFGVFESSDGECLAIIGGQELTTVSASINGFQLIGGSQYAGSRYWTFDGSLWERTQNCALGFLFDPTVSSSELGIRTGRAGRSLSGSRRHFNFGFINSGAIANDTVILTDIGDGLQKYRSCFHMGPSSPCGGASLASDLSGPILPWAG